MHIILQTIGVFFFACFVIVQIIFATFIIQEHLQDRKLQGKISILQRFINLFKED